MATTTKELSLRLGKRSGVLYDMSDEERGRLQATLLSMLADLKKACGDIGISFCLMGGSALGAVRHGGFIPWDDDLDVAMTRHDWEIFLAGFGGSMLAERYELDAAGYGDCDPKSVLPKLCLKDSVYILLEEMGFPRHNNIFLDIFVIDGVSDNPVVRAVDAFISDNLRFVSNSVGAYKHPNRHMRRAMSRTWKTRVFYRARLLQGLAFSVVPHVKWCEWFHRYAARHEGERTRLTTVAAGLKRYRGETLDRDTWFPYSEGTFEGVAVNLPHDVEKYLTNIYGDYMKLPPPEERVVHPIVKLEIPDD